MNNADQIGREIGESLLAKGGKQILADLGLLENGSGSSSSDNDS